jgi:FKBP-type peptidyl-prolyl cis-trans isomerase (trigger factor)
VVLVSDGFSEAVHLTTVPDGDPVVYQVPPFGMSINIDFQNPTHAHAIITLQADVIDLLYHEAASSQQHTAQVAGFNRGDIPLGYVKNKFKEILSVHLKEFFIKYCVASFLYQELRNRKIVAAGDPTVTDIFLEPGRDAQFTFELSVIPKMTIYEWRYLPFKAAKRKNYKDLDRQVEFFLKEERERQAKYSDSAIAPGDWVNFDITVTNRNKQDLVYNSAQNYWFKIGDDDTESPLREIFIGQAHASTFFSNNQDLQSYFSDHLDTNYQFKIDVKDYIPHAYFCIENFKRHFRIKTNKELQQKLIEIFSFRNDISQRREIIEEAFNLLLSKHQLTVPESLVTRQQMLILEAVKKNPDYPVYRVQPDFQDQLKNLAHKQVHEMIFIDHLAYHENISVTHADIKSYLNLTNRPRMKEFLYFNLPNTKVQDQEMPVACEFLKRTVLREKMLNYAIYQLMKK